MTFSLLHQCRVVLCFRQTRMGTAHWGGKTSRSESKLGNTCVSAVKAQSWDVLLP